MDFESSNGRNLPSLGLFHSRISRGLSNGIRAVGVGEEMTMQEQLQAQSESTRSLKRVMEETLKKLDQLLEKQVLLTGSRRDGATTPAGGNAVTKQGLEEARSSSRERMAQEGVACIFFQKGCCFRGHLCPFLHDSSDTPPSDDEGGVPMVVSESESESATTLTPQLLSPPSLGFGKRNEAAILTLVSPNQSVRKLEMHWVDGKNPDSWILGREGSSTSGVGRKAAADQTMNPLGKPPPPLPPPLLLPQLLPPPLPGDGEKNRGTQRMMMERREDFEKIKQYFLNLHLEDKVKVWDAGIDKPLAFRVYQRRNHRTKGAPIKWNQLSKWQRAISVFWLLAFGSTILC